MDNKMNTQTVTLKDLWEILVRRWTIILFAAVAVVAGTFTFIQITYEPLYASTATLYILRQNGEGVPSNEVATDFSLALNVLDDCTGMLKSKTVLNKIIEELEPDTTYTELYDRVSTHNPENTRLLEVTVEAHSPELAKEIVDNICTFGAVCINDAMGYEQVNLFETGDVSDEPCNQAGWLTYGILGAVAAMLTYLVFIVLRLVDDTVKSDEDIERALGQSVLSVIPAADAARKKGRGNCRAGADQPRAETEEGVR